MGFIGTVEEVSYNEGVDDVVRVQTGVGGPLHNSDTRDRFWYALGESHQSRRQALIPWALVVATALTQQQRDWYQEGFEIGQIAKAGKLPGPAKGPVGDPDYGRWINAGVSDGRLYDFQRYVITTEAPAPPPPRPPSSPVVVVPPVGPVPPSYRGAPIYEVAAYFAGKRVPLDQLLAVSNFTDRLLKNPVARLFWKSALRFDVLGDAPGEEREGYRLSGPRGPVARYLAVIQSQANPPFPVDPSYYGLPAFFVTRVKGGGRRGGIRFLSRRELEDLGIDPNAGFEPLY